MRKCPVRFVAAVFSPFPSLVVLIALPRAPILARGEGCVGCSHACPSGNCGQPGCSGTASPKCPDDDGSRPFPLPRTRPVSRRFTDRRCYPEQLNRVRQLKLCERRGVTPIELETPNRDNLSQTLMTRPT